MSTANHAGSSSYSRCINLSRNLYVSINLALWGLASTILQFSCLILQKYPFVFVACGCNVFICLAASHSFALFDKRAANVHADMVSKRA